MSDHALNPESKCCNDCTSVIRLRPCPKKFERQQQFLSTKGGAPNGLGRANRPWSGAFAVAPWNLFDDHRATASAIDAPHRIQQEDEKPPQGNELKAPFGELVVTGRRQMAARADCGRTLAWSHSYFDALLVGTKVGVLIDKTPETMAAVLES